MEVMEFARPDDTVGRGFVISTGPSFLRGIQAKRRVGT